MNYFKTFDNSAGVRWINDENIMQMSILTSQPDVLVIRYTDGKDELKITDEVLKNYYFAAAKSFKYLKVTYSGDYGTFWLNPNKLKDLVYSKTRKDLVVMVGDKSHTAYLQDEVRNILCQMVGPSGYM